MSNPLILWSYFFFLAAEVLGRTEIRHKGILAAGLIENKSQMAQLGQLETGNWWKELPWGHRQPRD